VSPFLLSDLREDLRYNAALMCGRYSITLGYEDIISGVAADWFDAVEDSWDFVPRYNIAPTNRVPVIAMRDEKRLLGNMRWGLISSWAKDAKIGSS
tara:strand:+ start:1243 stop:1530 length:288 start_codon:yes stop_codon:yes gene_type:complete